MLIRNKLEDTVLAVKKYKAQKAKLMEELKEKIGLLKDRLENINATLQMPIGDKFHVQALRELIPELIKDVNLF